MMMKHNLRQLIFVIIMWDRLHTVARPFSSTGTPSSFVPFPSNSKHPYTRVATAGLSPRHCMSRNITDGKGVDYKERENGVVRGKALEVIIFSLLVSYLSFTLECRRQGFWLVLVV